MWVRMIVNVSGGRSNNLAYPPFGGDMDVDDWEGDHLVRAGVAIRIAPPVQEQQPVKSVTVAAPAEEVAPEPELPPEPEPEEAGPPEPADSKTAWVDYAVSQGEDSDSAARMTKADLISKYGGRL